MRHGGTGAFDQQRGAQDLGLGAGVTLGARGAIAGDPDTAASFSGASTAFAATGTPVVAPNRFAVEAWFRTTSRSGG